MMLCTSDTQTVQHATVDEFRLLRGKLLGGAHLRDVKSLQESIARFGLLSPIIVVRRAATLVVVDGRKRLAAIRRLSFQGRLPRSLVRIPYLIASEAAPHRSMLIHNRELYDAISEQMQAGTNLDTLADTYHLSRQCVRDILTLTRLDSIIREAFFNRLINISQAKAYAAIPDRVAQIRRLRQMGLFATADDILAQDEQDEPEALVA